jgi:hypothetical protein
LHKFQVKMMHTLGTNNLTIIFQLKLCNYSTGSD